MSACRQADSRYFLSFPNKQNGGTDTLLGAGPAFLLYIPSGLQHLSFFLGIPVVLIVLAAVLRDIADL